MITSLNFGEYLPGDDGKGQEINSYYQGFSAAPTTRPCYFTFVEDDFPLGVVPNIVQAQVFDYIADKDTEGGQWLLPENYIIGFGKSNTDIEEDMTRAIYNGASYGSIYEDGFKKLEINPFDKDDESSIRSIGYMAELLEKNPPTDNSAITNDFFRPASGSIVPATAEQRLLASLYGGNDLNYFSYIMDDTLQNLSKEKGYERFKQADYRENSYIDVYDVKQNPLIARAARANYDEDFDITTRVIAGDGRTLRSGQGDMGFF